MRVKNTKITLNMHIPIGTPDCNGVIFTKEAVTNALNHLNQNIPIIFNDTESDLTAKCIGMTTSNTPIVTWDAENQVCKLTIDGLLYHSGAKIAVRENEGNKITNCEFVSIGLTI